MHLGRRPLKPEEVLLLEANVEAEAAVVVASRAAMQVILHTISLCHTRRLRQSQ